MRTITKIILIMTAIIAMMMFTSCSVGHSSKSTNRYEPAPYSYKAWRVSVDRSTDYWDKKYNYEHKCKK